MIEREITRCLTRLFQQYPFVTVTGPRQSGKTTLCRSAFPHLKYANLEAPDVRDFAESDPRGFLSEVGEGAILDEIQHVPELLSYLQVLADERGTNGQFVLTGSEHFKLSNAISQSLAGRTALLLLLPLSMAERRRMGARNELDDMLYSGFYPRIFDQNLDPRQALGDYFETYVERDVRRLGGIRNLSIFRRFVRLCAGRVGQLVNLSSLGSDAGVSHTTAREWLGVLERSYISFLLRPYHANIGKRLIRSPKLYFYDVGLASHLIGIENAQQMGTHPLRGPLFENAVVVEALKHGFNRGHQPNLFFFRDARGLECDLFYETGRGISAIEIKSGATVASDYFHSLDRVAELVPEVNLKALVYGGVERQSRSDCEVVPVAEFGGVLQRFEVEQELATFVPGKKGPGPDAGDVNTLDSVYAEHIWPLIAELDSVSKPLAQELFARGLRGAVIGGKVNGGGLLQRNRWENTKSNWIVRANFVLSDDLPLVLEHKYTWQNYTGVGRRGFEVTLSAMWELGGEGFSRRVSIDGAPLAALDDRIVYPELETKSPEVDRVVAEISRALLDRIAVLSGR